VIEANTINAIVEIVRHGEMVTILPDAIAFDNAALKAIRITPALPQRTVALLRRKEAYQSAASLAFIALAESMANQDF